MSNELAIILADLALIGASVYAGVKKAFFQCLAAAGAALFVAAEYVSSF